MRLLGVILLTMSLLYVRPMASIGFVFGSFTAVGMLLMATFASEKNQ